MKRSFARRAAAVAAPLSLAALAIAACGGPITPPLTAAPDVQALAGQNDAPLIIDWPANQRGNLEIAMDRGVAVVSYSKGKIQLLDDCKLDGTYGFSKFKLKEQVIAFESGDELRANLPLGGAGLAVKLDAEMKRGATLEVALVMIGKRAATWASAKAEEVQGPASCKAATHFVRGVFVGAFAMQVGAKSKASTAVEIFGGKSGWAGDVSKSIRTTDGSIDDCRKASSDDAVKAPNCGALLNLELVAIDGGNADAKSIGAGSASCPAGFVRADGQCKNKAAVKTHECKKNDWADCEEQCQLGDARSCGTLGFMLFNDRTGRRDFNRAAEVYKKGCDGGSEFACAGVGFLHMRGKVLPQDYAKAAKLFEHACENGEPRGCNNRGSMHAEGLAGPRDYVAAVKLFQRACDTGFPLGCTNLGVFQRYGDGTPRDPKKAAASLKKSCDGDDALGCVDLGDMHVYGYVEPKERAEALYVRACDLGAARGCLALADGYVYGRFGKDAEKAKSYYDQGMKLYAADCEAFDGVACSALANMYAVGRGTDKDEQKALELITRSCKDAGHMDGCVTLGGAHHHARFGLQRDAANAQTFYEKACTAGYATGCFVLAQLLEEETPNEAGTRIVELLTKACDAESFPACNEVARRYEIGRGIDKDPAKAYALYMKMCDRGRGQPSGAACTSASAMVDAGAGVAADRKKANELLAKGCKLEHGRACYMLAVRLEEGTGADKDYKRAADIYKQACDHGEPDACDRLAKMYTEGRGITQNADEAIAIHKKGCDTGRPSSCNALGMLYEQGAEGIKKDEMQAAVFYRKACDMYFPAACKQLADLYAEGRGVGRDVKKAASIYEQACRFSGGSSCTAGGKLYVAQGDKDSIERGVALLQRGCASREGEGCWILAGMLEQGKLPVVKRDPPSALHRYEEACSYRWPEACAKAGAAYKSGGLGAKADAAKAKELAQRACELGNKPSCTK